MNVYLFIAGMLAFITFLIHTFYGGKEIARPLLKSKIDQDVKMTVYATWHMVTVTLLASAGVFLYAGAGYDIPYELLLFVSVGWILFGMVFLWINVCKMQPRTLFGLPQWVMLLPVGILGILGVLL